MAFRFFPKTFNFFALFEKQVGHAVEAACLFKEIVAGGVITEDAMSRIASIEHQGDDVAHRIIDQLNKTFITPFDREDIYALAKQLDDKKAYADAAVAYSKAHGLDPKGDRATDALAAQHYMQGKALEASGKDGGPDFRKAVALKPDYAPAQDAAESASPSKKPTWMLYAALIAGAFAALLFAAAMMKRRRV